MGGAKRTSRRAPHFLVPKELVEAVAVTRLEGNKKYGADNWKNGDKEFFIRCVANAIDHLLDIPDLGTDESAETHLGHAACNIAFVLWAMKRGLITREDFLNAGEFL